MKNSIIGGIIFLILGFICVTSPWQFFARTPVVVKIVKSDPFKKYIKFVGYGLLFAGVFFELFGFIKH